MQLSFEIKNSKNFSDIAARQVPFVLARMNSKLAADITFKVREQIPSNFRGKTRFVQSGMLYERGNKQDPTARVVNRDAHMWTHEAGQTIDRSRKGHRLLVPSQHYRMYGKTEKPSDLIGRPQFFRTKDGIFKRRSREHSTAYFWYSDRHNIVDPVFRTI
ncbi:MAG: hypothetical protein HRU09_19415 [Oligoflexales bacterium]|nr:hypothetical protein [Oligoflexales bacterium]